MHAKVHCISSTVIAIKIRIKINTIISQTRNFFLLIYYFSITDCKCNFYISHFFHRNLKNISVKNCDICKFTCFQSAKFLFPEISILTAIAPCL